MAVGLVLAAGGAWADAPTSGPAEPAEPARDYCASAIDPFDPVEEFIRFCLAAGDDRQLDEQEFQANREQTNPFVRIFDLWEQIIRFERKGDGKINWPEANRYRRRLRKKVLETYDADGNGRLKDAERQAANKALAEGNVPAVEPAWRTPDGADANTPTSQPAEMP